MFKVFVRPIPGESSEEAEEEALNRFLSMHRILSVQSQLTTNVSGSYWVWCVEYVESNRHADMMSTGAALPKVDYATVLAPIEFSRYNALRELRKKFASEEAVKPFVVFTNAQLAELARRNPSSLAALKDVDGIGEARCQKYGQRVLEVLATCVEKPESEVPAT